VLILWTSILAVNFSWFCSQNFRSEKSTENAPYVLLNDILTALNNKQMVGGIFCDLHKAFDFINHTVLLEKMKFYGVSRKFYNLIKSYLDGRYKKSSLKSQQWYWIHLGENKTRGTPRINCGTVTFSNLYKRLAKLSIHWNLNPFMCRRYQYNSN